MTIQPKLDVNTPGDIYEQEADHIAEQVMHTPEPQLQRTCACGGDCAKCQTDQPGQERARLQTRQVGSSEAGQTAAPTIVHEVLASTGQPLDASTRAFFEPRFGHDFSQVRVHTDAPAAQSAEAVAARAYTVGSDVVHGVGNQTPARSDDMRLLAHELAHVVQQNRNHAAGGALQRKVVTTEETPPVVRLRIGVDVEYMLASKAWEQTASGPLNDNDLALLRPLALLTGQTIDDNERMFLAALLDPVNAKKLHAEHPHGFFIGEDVEFDASSITSANRVRVRDFGRAANMEAPGPRTEPNTEAGHATALDRDIIAMAGPFAGIAREALTLADSARVLHLQVYYAMLNGASDSTPGDRAFAGAVYVVARQEQLASVANDLMAGRFKVDQVPRSQLGEDAQGMYMPIANSAGSKGDTLYLPSDWSLNLEGQGTAVHELTHVSQDAEAASSTLTPVVDAEMPAFVEEAYFYLSAISKRSGAARDRAVEEIAKAIRLPGLLCAVLAATEVGGNTTALAALRELHAKVLSDGYWETAKGLSASDFAALLAGMESSNEDRQVETFKELTKRIHKAIQTAYRGVSPGRQDKFRGESALDAPAK
jgi:hypothetical protein